MHRGQTACPVNGRVCMNLAESAQSPHSLAINVILFCCPSTLCLGDVTLREHSFKSFHSKHTLRGSLSLNF